MRRVFFIEVWGGGCVGWMAGLDLGFWMAVGFMWVGIWYCMGGWEEEDDDDDALHHGIFCVRLFEMLE